MSNATDTRAPASRASWLPTAALLVVLVAWASAFVGIRAAAPHLRPGPFALGRLLVALPVLVLLVRGRSWRGGGATEDRTQRRRALAMMVAYGLAWFAAYNVVLNAAGARIDAGTASLLVNVGPLLVAVVAGVALDEGFPRPLVVGLGLALAGVAVIGVDNGVDTGSALGVVLALTAAACYATGVLTQKVALRTFDPPQVTLGAAIAGTLALAPFLPQLIDDLRAAPAEALAWLVYLGVVATALGFWLYGYALSHSTAGRTASATLAVPAITVVISWLVLDEIPSALTLVGGAAALVGVAISRR